MKIGVIYFSHTGHTAQVVDSFVADSSSAGLDISKIALEPEGPLQLSAVTVPLKRLPDVSGFDVLVMATPVHGGRMSAPMMTFLETVPTLEGKRIAYLLTHFLPRKWGAVQTIEVMEGLCWEKGGKILGTTDVTWFGLGRNRRISQAIDHLKELMAAKK